MQDISFFDVFFVVWFLTRSDRSQYHDAGRILYLHHASLPCCDGEIDDNSLTAVQDFAIRQVEQMAGLYFTG